MSSNFIAYLIIFLPLISAIFCFLISSLFAKTNFLITLSTLIAVFFLSLKLLPILLTYEQIQNNTASAGLISIATEYYIDLLALFSLLLIIAIKIIVSVFYRKDTDKIVNQSSAQLFYVVNLLNLFAIIGIITTNNIFNLYIFIEIYSFTFYAITSLAAELPIARLSLQYFCQSVLGGILLLIAFLAIYIITGQSKINLLSENINYLFASDNFIAKLLFWLILSGIVLKFFPHQFYNSKISGKISSKNFITNFIDNSAIFVKSNLGLYLLQRTIFTMFGSNLIFSEFKFYIILTILGLILIFYANSKLLKLLNTFTKNLKSIANNIILSNLGLVIITIAINSKIATIGGNFYIINYSLIGLLLFFVSANKDSNMANLIFKITILLIAYLPLTLGFWGNFYLTLALMDFSRSWFLSLLALLALLINNFIAFKLVLKMSNNQEI